MPVPPGALSRARTFVKHPAASGGRSEVAALFVVFLDPGAFASFYDVTDIPFRELM